MSEVTELRKEVKKLVNRLALVFLFGFLGICFAITYNTVFLINNHSKEVKETAIKMLGIHECPGFYKNELRKRADLRDKEKRI